MTEVPSRFLFAGCLLAGLGFWTAESTPKQRIWLIAACVFAFGAMALRTEHVLVGPIWIAGLVALRWRRPAFKQYVLTCVACGILGVGVLGTANYMKFGTLGPGSHPYEQALGLIEGLPPHRTFTFTDDEREFWERYVIPASKTPGGRANASAALPAFFPEMKPREFAKMMSDYSLGVLGNNVRVLWGLSVSRFKGRITRQNWPWPCPHDNAECRPAGSPVITEDFQRIVNFFGLDRPPWRWPLGIALWMLGRWLWGRRYGVSMRGAGIIATGIAWSYYWHQALVIAVGQGETRQSYFVTGFLPTLGLVVVLDSIGVLIMQLRIWMRGSRGRV